MKINLINAFCLIVINVITIFLCQNSLHAAQVIDFSTKNQTIVLELTASEQISLLIGSELYLSFYQDLQSTDLTVTPDQNSDQLNIDTNQKETKLTSQAKEQNTKLLSLKRLKVFVKSLDNDLATLSFNPADLAFELDQTFIGKHVTLSKDLLTNDDFLSRKELEKEGVGLSIGLYSGFDSRTSSDLGFLIGYRVSNLVDTELNISKLGRYQRGRAHYKITSIGLDVKPYIFDKVYLLSGLNYLHYKEKFYKNYPSYETSISKLSSDGKANKNQDYKSVINKYHDKGIWFKLGIGTSLDYPLSYHAMKGISVGLQFEYSILLYQISQSYKNYHPIGNKVLGNKDAYLAFRVSFAPLF